MKKEFVSYEQALALKELGFDEKCLMYYHDKELVFTPTPSLNTNSFWIGRSANFVTAPLKQQVFRWFREKYGLVGNVEAAYHTNIETYLFAYTIWEGKVENYGGCNWEVYEEAENDCIDYLITLSKQHN